MAALFRVVAVLAESPERPLGDPAQVLTLHVPLLPDGQLDPDTMRQLGDYLRAELMRADTLVWSSPVVSSEEDWAVRPESSEEAPLWRLTTRTLRPGEYLTLHPDAEREQSYRVVNVEQI